MNETILQGQSNIAEKSFVKRDFVFSDEILKLNKMISFVGPRRSGKTFIMYQVVRELIQSGYCKLTDVVFVDFNSFIGGDFDFDQLEQSFFGLYPDGKPLFVFDEIQEIDNFRQGVFSLYNKGYKIFLSGSNAKLLSSELSTHFRGKVYQYDIAGLSRNEFLRFKNQDIMHFYTLKQEGIRSNLFHEYMDFGFYPEIALVDNVTIKMNIAKSYLDVMIYKDVIERFKVGNEYVIKYLINRMISGSTKQLSLNKIYQDLKSQNIKVGPDTLYDYFGYLEQVFFVSSLSNVYSPKGQKKIMIIDPVYQSIYNGIGKDYGQKFEEIVYHHLKGEKIGYKKNGSEIDFWSEEDGDVQVCYSLNSENVARELRGLSEDGKLVVFENLSTVKDRRIVSWWEFVG